MTEFRHTDGTKKRLSEMRSGSRNPFFGKKHSAETLAKMANASRLRHERTQRYKITGRTIKIPQPLEAAYAAGLIDGEGSITKRGGRPYVLVYNTDKRIHEWLISRIGGTIEGVDNRGRTPSYSWSVASARNVFALLRSVLPFLVIKKDKAVKIMEELEAKYGPAVTEETNK